MGSCSPLSYMSVYQVGNRLFPRCLRACSLGSGFSHRVGLIAISPVGGEYIWPGPTRYNTGAGTQ